MNVVQKVLLGVLVAVFVGALGTLGMLVGKPMWQERMAARHASSAPVTASSAVEGASDLKVGVSAGGMGGGLPEPLAGATGASGGGGPASSSASGKDDLAQYEKYKGDKAALFGEIRPGTGNEAAANKKVAIYYKGRLTDGTVFDESKASKAGEQPQPLVFTIGEHKVIPGMEQGVIGMKGGGQRRIIIPPSVGYGDRGYGPVPSNAVLVFDIELVDVQ